LKYSRALSVGTLYRFRRFIVNRDFSVVKLRGPIKNWLEQVTIPKLLQNRCAVFHASNCAMNALRFINSKTNYSYLRLLKLRKSTTVV
jgi:hypothetical protein